MKKMERPAGGSGKKRKLSREELAVLLSVVATVVVIVQRFLADNDLLLLPSQTMALEASVQATTLALTKLQMMFSIAEVVSWQDQNSEKNKLGPSSSRTDRETTISTCWFHRFTSTIVDDRTWRENFRMSRPTFYALMDILRPVLDNGNPEPCPCPCPGLLVPVDYKLGAALYRLAHGASFKSVGRKFGIPTASACRALYEVCRALENRLHHLSEFPSSAEGLYAIINGFTSLGMPNCCGIVGHMRFAVDSPPPDGPPAEDYRDPQRRYGVIMQGLVDAGGRFLDVSVGWPGSYTPPRILPQTSLYTRVEDSHELFRGPAAELINGVPMPQYIIGDSSCPLYQWLLTPYLSEGLLTPAQELYNSVHEHARSASPRAFEMLKSQWQLLTFRQNAKFLPRIVIATCVLHNFLIQYGEPLPDVQETVGNDFPVAYEGDEFGESIRDALAAHIAMVAQMRTQL